MVILVMVAALPQNNDQPSTHRPFPQTVPTANYVGVMRKEQS